MNNNTLIIQLIVCWSVTWYETARWKIVKHQTLGFEKQSMKASAFQSEDVHNPKISQDPRMCLIWGSYRVIPSMVSWGSWAGLVMTNVDRFQESWEGREAQSECVARHCLYHSAITGHILTYLDMKVSINEHQWTVESSKSSPIFYCLVVPNITGQLPSIPLDIVIQISEHHTIHDNPWLKKIN